MELITKLNEVVATLRNLSPHPAPPEISYIVEKDSLWVQECLFMLEPSIIRLPLDGKYYLTNQSNFLNIIAWHWVDSREWVKDKFDCENFAITLKADVDWYFGLNQVGIVIDYKAGHGYNLVVFPDGKVMLLEPQNDRMFVWPNLSSLYVLKNAFVLL